MSEVERHAKDFDPSTLVIEKCKYMQAIWTIQDLTAINAELLEALKAIVYWHDQDRTIDESWWDAARAAIFKATGEQQ